MKRKHWDPKGLRCALPLDAGGMSDPIINGEKFIGILAMPIEDGLSTTSFDDLFGERNTEKGLNGDFGFSIAGPDSCFFAPKFKSFILLSLLGMMSLTSFWGCQTSKLQQLINCLGFSDF